MNAQSTRCAVDGPGKAYVTWVPPSSDGGSPITGYRVTAWDYNTKSFLATQTASGSATSWVYTGLTGGDTYSFAVAAVNPVGTGQPVYTNNTMSPPTVPSQMNAQSTRCSPHGSGQAYVYWVPPSSDGGSPITAYRITAWDFNTSSFLPTQIASASATSWVYTGLKDGDGYNFAVAAVNAVGVGQIVYTNSMSPPSTTGP